LFFAQPGEKQPTKKIKYHAAAGFECQYRKKLLYGQTKTAPPAIW
jgi:hypothetical protein